MTIFIAPTARKLSVKTRRKAIVYLCNLSYPDSLAEQIPLEHKCALDSQHLESFYDVPVAGDCVVLIGCLWRVTQRTHYPYKPYSRKEKRISEVYLEYLEMDEHSEHPGAGTNPADG